MLADGFGPSVVTLAREIKAVLAGGGGGVGGGGGGGGGDSGGGGHTVLGRKDGDASLALDGAV